MKTSEIIEKLDSAIHDLLHQDYEILKRGLNDLNLNGHLSRYLAPHFEGYNVDSEYNGDIAKLRDRKEIQIAKGRLREIGLASKSDNLYELTPDIIVHIRNTNDHNLLVLEVKKDSNSKKNRSFDLLKLEHMTIDYQGNHYNYRVGAAIVFGTVDNAGYYDIQYFQEGIPCDKENLK